MRGFKFGFRVHVCIVKIVWLSIELIDVVKEYELRDKLKYCSSDHLLL